jgi:lactate dehydrogenase-like 2-hydroxyacid dehydrogenase
MGRGPLEGVDIEAATAHGMAVANVPSHECSNADSVAEWRIMATIALSRKFPIDYSNPGKESRS